MPWKPKQLYIARVRIEPTSHEELEKFFEWINVARPNGLAVKKPQPEHKALYAFFDPCKARSWRNALGLVEWAAKRQLIKPSGVQIKGVAVQVQLVAEGDEWPEDWFDPNDVDKLGSKVVG
jgi:hypothetical protein